MSSLVKSSKMDHRVRCTICITTRELVRSFLSMQKMECLYNQSHNTI